MTSSIVGLLRHRARRDLLLLVGATLVTYALSVRLDAFELLVEGLESHEHIEIDEIPLALLVLSLGLAWFPMRRAAEARAAARVKGEFVALVCHELRTPLTGMLGFSHLLAEDESTPETQRTWASHILAAARRLTRIVDDLLDVSGIDGGRLEIEEVAVGSAELLAEAIESVRVDGSHHAIELVAVDDVAVMGDRNRLVQVFHNLIENAVKYSPDGGTVRVSSEVQADGLRVCIADEGMGIPRDALPKLFDRFYRAPLPGHENIRGTGLGLYVVDELLRRMGGQVDVESTVGHGTTFAVTLRLAERRRQQAA